MTTATRKASKPKARPLGRWSPGTATRRAKQRDTLKAARSIQLAILRMFREQRKWLNTNWRLVATKSQQRRLLKQVEGVTQWGDWVESIAGELAKPLGAAMKVGAGNAQNEIAITVDWTLDSPQAQKFVQRHGLELARGINRVTTKRIRARIAAGLKDGQSTAEIGRSIQSLMRTMTPQRARLMAQTETIRAMAEGSLQVYEEAGVKEKKWINHRPNHDAICDRLHDQVVGIDKMFVDPDTGIEYHAPPAHPGCQCTVRGVVI